MQDTSAVRSRENVSNSSNISSSRIDVCETSRCRSFSRSRKYNSDPRHVPRLFFETSRVSRFVRPRTYRGTFMSPHRDTRNVKSDGMYGNISCRNPELLPERSRDSRLSENSV